MIENVSDFLNVDKFWSSGPLLNCKRLLVFFKNSRVRGESWMDFTWFQWRVASGQAVSCKGVLVSCSE